MKSLTSIIAILLALSIIASIQLVDEQGNTRPAFVSLVEAGGKGKKKKGGNIIISTGGGGGGHSYGYPVPFPVPINCDGGRGHFSRRRRHAIE